MRSLLLVLGLILYLTVVGQAIIALLRPRLGVLRSWFLSPSVGLVVLLLIVTRLSVWGIPVQSSGPWLFFGLLIFAAGILAWRRPALPWRQLLPFCIVAILFVFYVGWPALRFGFNWISYGNDDMANYVLAAERFLRHGYYELPLQTDLEGRDYSQHYWFMHALQQIRPGSELTIAWVASIAGLRSQQVFMPVILMLSLVQLFAMAAVALYKGRHRRLTLLAVFLLATSPLFGLGTLYQLIAQVGGMAIVLAGVAVLLSTSRLTWRTLLLGSFLTAGLALFYPEVSPFLALAILLYGLRLRYSDTALFKRYLLFIGGVAVLTFLLIASNTYEFINTVVMQSVGSAGLGAMTEINDQSGGLVLFPWTLVPSFVPMLFGIHPFGVVGNDPWMSLAIFAGFCLLGYFLWRIYRNLVDDVPVAYLGVIMLAMDAYFFLKGGDFQLFKLAMYTQPIIAICLAQGFVYFLYSGIPDRQKWARWAVVVFFAATIYPEFYYTNASLGLYGGGLTEVVKASQLGTKFDPPKNLKYGGIESDINNVVTAKMLSLSTRGIDTRFLSRSYMDNIANIAVLKFLRTPNPDLGPQARIIEKLSLLRWLLPKEIMTGDVPDYEVMTIHKPGNNWTETSSRHLDYNGRLFVAVRTDLDHFNKANPGDGWTVQHMFQYKLESQVQDRLVFIHSELSPHYYSSARFRAAFFQREPEPVTKGKAYEVYFHGTGQYNLFHIINPSPKLRVMVDFTVTDLGNGRSLLPPKAFVEGEENYPIPFVGHGSARVVTEIIKPEYFEQQAYITLNFNEYPHVIVKPPSGLMRLYGQKYALDDRRLIGFTRDISVITDAQYQALPRPTKISDFPDDLARYPGLEYSGLYEDGWIADDSYFKLGASHPGQVLYFKGYIPDNAKFRAKGMDLTISINDKPTEVVHLTAGDFILTRLIKEPAAITSISMHFSDSEVFDSGVDLRPVSASVREISIGDIPDLASFKRLANQKGDKFDLKGVDDDGWIAQTAQFKAPVFSDFKVLKIDMEMPGWSPLASNTLTVSLDGQVVQTDRVPRETYQSLYLPLPPGVSRTVQLESSAVFPLPGETRSRSFLIKNISFENISPTDLFLRGWHKSGYLFSLDRPDSDGWVDRKVSFSFPATPRFHTAIVEVVRYPSRSDLPLSIWVDGTAQPDRTLGLDHTERIQVALSADRATTLELSAPRDFPLAAPDTRSRSFRLVNVDFE
jgi:hypothetical protein